MRIKNFWPGVLLLMFFTLSLAAEERSAVFAPFVSRLQGEARNNLIRLTWQDSSDVRGPVYIFRSSEPIVETSSFFGIRPVEIPYGVQSYVDEIEYGGVFHYFVAASDETGRRFDIFIGPNNLVSLQVEAPAGTVPAFSPAQGEMLSTAQVWSGISSLETVRQDESIIISFTAGNVRNAALYRSVRPIVRTNDLIGAVIIRTRVSSPFTDFPVPGIPYYYAVIDEDDLVRGTVSIVPGLNASLSPVEVSPGGTEPGLDSSARNMRNIPLPELSSFAAGPGNGFVSGPAELSPQAVRVLGNISVDPSPEPVLKSPRVFTRDMEARTVSGEESALSSIIRGPFRNRDWERAADEINSFLALPRGDEVTARARFYLGQCLFFMNQPREGLFEFLAVQDFYPNESREWVEASLDLMRK